MNATNTVLKHIAKFIVLTTAEQDEFASILVHTEIQKKAVLIKPDSFVDQLYFVGKGCLKAYYLDDSGNKYILQFAVENYWITDFDAFENGIPSNLYIEAIEDCFLFGIKKESLTTLFVRIPRFERFFRIVFTDAFIALRKRVLSSLQNSTTSRYMEFCENYPSIEKRVTNYHIANYLGITAESLSRIRKELPK